MCGIAGFLSFNKQLHQQHSKAMADAIAHRGPDAEGFYFEDKEQFNVGLAHRRLSILDLSDTANQPMKSHCGRYIMVFNGEVFNYQDIAKEHMPDTAWQTHSDSEVILECFARYGIDAVQWFNGMFAIAFYDTEGEVLTLVRDRMGIKPLVYYRDEHNIAFASELKALLTLPFKKELNETAVQDYFFLEYVPGTQTIFKAYQKLPAGHYAVVTKKGFQIKEYWNVLDKINLQTTIKTEDEYLEEFDLRFKQSVKYRMISDVPIGAFLSGGTDSSLVCAAFQQISPSPINTFTIGFDVESFDETGFAREVADQLKTNHRTYKISEADALPIWNKSTRFYDEPFGVSSIIPSMLVCQKAKQNVTVALAGDGGDELFFGYGYYEWYNRVARVQKIAGNTGRVLSGKIMQQMGGKWKEKSGYFNYPNYDTAAINLWSQEQQMFSEKEISALTNTPYKHETLAGEWAKVAGMDVDNYSKIALFDIRNYLAQDLLYKMDIASMANSLEVRLPFLDYNFVEWAINVPSALKVKATQKYLPKKYLAKSLTHNAVYRKKWGFPAPTNKWFKGQLRNEVSALLAQKNDLNSAFIQQMFKDFLASDKDLHGKKIFALVQYIKWKEAFGGG